MHLLNARGDAVRHADVHVARRELLPDLAEELVGLKVDVIVAVPGAIEAARDATKTIPIVLTSGNDPVERGLVASLARPGGNITGTAESTIELAGKRLELLKEALPRVSRVAVLWNDPDGSGQGNVDRTALALAPRGFLAITPDGRVVERTMGPQVRHEVCRAITSVCTAIMLGALYLPAMLIPAKRR